MQKQTTSGFADISISQRIIKTVFFNQINKIIDWNLIAKQIEKFYTKGQSQTGRPSYDGLLLFKICLLQTWYNLSDYEVEDCVNDRISFSRFVGLSIDAKSPDHSIISRFRTEMTKNKAYEVILKLINTALAKHQIIIKTGTLVDASITDRPRNPRGKKVYVANENSQEEEDEIISETKQNTPTNKSLESKKESNNQAPLKEKIQKHVDQEAEWVIKNKRLRYGYKKHVVTTEEGLVLGVLTTAANINEVSNLEEVLNKVELPKACKIKGDKGYKSKKNDELLKAKEFKNHIMHKAKRCKELSSLQIKFNKLISKKRYKIEQTFGGMSRWFGAGKARYVGLAKMHTQHVMEAIAFNLYRSPRLILLTQTKNLKSITN